MIASETEFLGFMDEHRLEFQRIEHPAVFTCAEAERHHAGVDAVSTKNLFLCDKKGRRFFLAVTACERSVDLARLAVELDAARLRFGSEENLRRLLGVSRGSVTMMGLVNDTDRQVELWIDQAVWNGERFFTHPLVNTATLIVSKPVLERFFQLSGHPPRFFGGR